MTDPTEKEVVALRSEHEDASMFMAEIDTNCLYILSRSAHIMLALVSIHGLWDKSPVGTPEDEEMVRTALAEQLVPWVNDMGWRRIAMAVDHATSLTESLDQALTAAQRDPLVVDRPIIDHAFLGAPDANHGCPMPSCNLPAKLHTEYRLSMHSQVLPMP